MAQQQGEPTMIQRSTLMHAALAGAVLALAAGCGSMSMPGKAAGGGTDTYEATLNGTQEVPPNTSAGTGKAEVQVDPRTYKVRWRVTHSGLSGPATAAHIHGPAAPTANAGVVVPFTGDVNASPITGEATLTPAQYADLAAGLYYVNVHTARAPAGEIRGQLKKRGM
jgi:hypothetical protein